MTEEAREHSIPAQEADLQETAEGAAKEAAKEIGESYQTGTDKADDLESAKEVEDAADDKAGDA